MWPDCYLSLPTAQQGQLTVLARAFEALRGEEALGLWTAEQPSKDMLAFSLIECVMNISARVNAIKRRHSHKDVPFTNKGWKMPDEQGYEQTGDMKAV